MTRDYDSGGSVFVYYVTVEDILNLDIARDWKVLAGAGGLGKTVSWFYICQENEIAPWVQGRELMILYGSGVKRDTANLVRMVEICAERQISAILVLIGHYFLELPAEMLDEADKLDVPIITMPASIPIGTVTKAVAYMMFSERHSMRRGGEALRDIIYGYDEDERSHFNTIERAGYKLRKRSFVAVMRTSDGALYEMTDTQHILTDVCSVLNTPVAYIQKNRIVALTGTDDQNSVHSLMEAGERLVSLASEKYGLRNMYFALGSQITSRNNIKSSYRDAVNTVRAIKVYPISRKCRNYAELPAIIRMLFRTDDHEFIRSCFSQELGGIIDYDKKHNAELLMTLERFFEENCNASRAADKLYIHRNTMNNRLRLIFDILGHDCSDPEKRFAVECSIYCYKYFNMQEEQK